MTHQERRDEMLKRYLDFANNHPLNEGREKLTPENMSSDESAVINAIAEFILSEQSKAVEEVSKILKTFKEEYLDFDPEEYPNNVHEVIKDYLSIADKYTKQGE